MKGGARLFRTHAGEAGPRCPSWRRARLGGEMGNVKDPSVEDRGLAVSGLSDGAPRRKQAGTGSQADAGSTR